MNPMRAFHNDPTLKRLYIERVRAHRAADEIIHGTYWQNGKGCALGCTIHSDTYKDYELLLGIPAALAHLEDSIFERLNRPFDQAWPEDFLEAVPVGANLEDVTRQFLHAVLTDPECGVLRHVTDPIWAHQREAIQRVADLLAHPEAAEAAGAAEAAWAATEAAEAATEAAEAAGAASTLWQRELLLGLLRVTTSNEVLHGDQA